MLITLRTNPRSKAFLVMVCASIFSSIAYGADLLLPSRLDGSISVTIRNQRVIAMPDRPSDFIYNVAASVAHELTKASEVRLLSNTNSHDGMLSVVLTRQLSRPAAMGRGYCGGGYEDVLLLIEVVRRKIALRDKFLLQSCLKNIYLSSDQGDNPAEVLIKGDNGSLSFSWSGDATGSQRTLGAENGRFQLNLLMPPAK